MAPSNPDGEGRSYDTYIVKIRRVSDGAEALCPQRTAWGSGSWCWWTDGNAACDCNLAKDFDRARGVVYGAPERPCGDGAYQVMAFYFPDGTSLAGPDADDPTVHDPDDPDEASGRPLTDRDAPVASCPECGMAMWQPPGADPVCVSPYCYKAAQTNTGSASEKFPVGKILGTGLLTPDRLTDPQSGISITYIKQFKRARWYVRFVLGR